MIQTYTWTNKRSIHMAFCLLTIIVFSTSVSGYYINVGPYEAKIYDAHEANTIQSNGDLKSNLWMFLEIPNNFSSRSDNITIYFSPREHVDNEPIKDYEILICDHPGSYDWSDDIGYDVPCEKPYNYSISKKEQQRYFISQGQKSLRNYSDFQITFTPNKSDVYQQFVFRIKYTTPNFIFKQGDYYVAWLSIPNMQDEGFQIESSLVLPTREDIPRFIPDAQRINRIRYYKEDKIFYR